MNSPLNAPNPTPLTATPTPVPDGFQEGTAQRPATAADIRREASKPAVAQDFRKTVISNRAELPEDPYEQPGVYRLGREFDEHRAQLRQHMRESLDSARGSAGRVYEDVRLVAGDLGQYARQNAVYARDYAESTITANPWRSVAAAGLIGLLAGALISRR
ncbi:MAG: hypothetical protein REI94_16710 [Moraxellaceae bacterium]|nr:hypothetical protein [Moraxellaceae bacterium]